MHPLALLLFLAGTLIPDSALAASVRFEGGNPLRWEQGTVPYILHQEGSTDITGGGDFNALDLAFSQWSTIPCSTIKFSFQGQTAEKNVTVVGYPTNGLNEVVWVEDTLWPAGQFVLGITTVSSYVGGTIIEADIAFNGFNQIWSTDGTPDTADVLSVATHEVGHFIGVQHSLTWPDPLDPPTMAPSADSEGKSQDLNSDDTIGACFLYPNNFGCLSDTDCPFILEDGPDGEFYSGQILCEGNACSGVSSVVPEGTQFIGEPCSSNFDCFEASSFCQFVSASQGYCAVSCDSPNTSICPPGLVCVGYANTAGGVCLPAEVAPSGGEKTLGSSCTSSAECESNLCISPAGGEVGFCASDCDPFGDVNCDSGFTCVPLTGAEQGACLPNKDESSGKYNGEACATASECLSGLCVGGGNNPGYFCRDACDAPLPNCPPNHTCELLDDEGTQGACIPVVGQESTLELGEECEENDDCSSNTCIDVTGGGPGFPFCTQACGSCPCGFTCSSFSDGNQWCIPGEKVNCIPDMNPCSKGEECFSGFCYEAKCQTKCSVTNPTCPPGQLCKGPTVNETNGICSSPGTLPLGAPCSSDDECATLFCESPTGQEAVCLRPCDPSVNLACGQALVCAPLKAGVGGCILASAFPNGQQGANSSQGENATSQFSDWSPVTGATGDTSGKFSSQSSQGGCEQSNLKASLYLVLLLLLGLRVPSTRLRPPDHHD